MGRIPYSGLPAHRLVFYTIGRVPSRIHTILHSSFVLRQPPPHHIHASEFSQARWYPDQPRNFSALRRYVGRIRFFIHSRSQPNNYYSSCRFRTAHRKDHFRRLTLRAAARQEVTPMVQTVGFEPTNPNLCPELFPPSFCLHISLSMRFPCVRRAFPVRCPLRAEPKPRPSGKKGEKKKNGDAEFAPASPMIKCVFSIFPLLSGIFKNYFSEISTTQG